MDTFVNVDRNVCRFGSAKKYNCFLMKQIFRKLLVLNGDLNVLEGTMEDGKDTGHETAKVFGYR
jgi:hypothetical protein